MKHSLFQRILAKTPGADPILDFMFELRVRRTFSAEHAIVMAGAREVSHWHDWVVTVAVHGDTLDADGLLCDFHSLEGIVDETIRPFLNRSLNETAPFDLVNPTAELVARHMAHAVEERLPDGVRVKEVRVVEAPNCEACFIPPKPAERGSINAGLDAHLEVTG